MVRSPSERLILTLKRVQQMVNMPLLTQVRLNSCNQCDVITINCPLHEGTRGLVNAELLSPLLCVLEHEQGVRKVELPGSQEADQGKVRVTVWDKDTEGFELFPQLVQSRLLLGGQLSYGGRRR